MRETLPIWRRLHLRMAFWVVVCLLGLGAALLWWTEHSTLQRQDAYTQWQSLGLARYIASRQPEPLIDADGRTRPALLDNTAMYVSMIQPSLEMYLLDRSGRILHHTLGKVAPGLAKVDLAAVQPLLQDPLGQLPVYGDDPNSPAQRNLVSIAPLPSADNVQGYLYVVLRGKQAQLLQKAAGQSQQRETAWRVICAVIALTALAIVAVQNKITRRLRNLAASLSQFRQPDDDHALESSRRARDELDQVAQAASSLQQRVVLQFQRLEDAERLRRDLISNISHDLHTPLATIQGYVETLLLQNGKLSADERKPYLETTLQHCRRLGRRVRELFELSKLESGQATLHPEAFCIAELLSDVVQSYQIKAQHRGVQLCLADTADLRAKVLADISLIERVLQNLVDNALRHTAAGGRVELTVQAKGAKVEVHVRDDGQGIAAADLPHIFERYWTSQGARNDGAPVAADDATGPAGSSGIGLAIVRRILELHGSRIVVSSAPSEGTEFRFALPVSSAS